MTTVLLVGLRPELVDFSTMPDLDAQKVQRGLDAQLAELRARGFDATWLLVDLGDTAEQVLRDALAATRYDVVLVGAGLRAVPAYFLLFERLLNAIHAGAPAAKLCFNTKPTDTLEAVLRWASP